MFPVDAELKKPVGRVTASPSYVGPHVGRFAFASASFQKLHSGFIDEDALAAQDF
jgi:hypothetical protein